jgi:transcriptional regulator with XRE-family HTH domain
MNPNRIGRVLRAIRLDQHLTQQVVADRAGLSQSVYSRSESGDLAGMTIRSLEQIVEALGAALSIDVRYRGGAGDRLADAAHAALVDYPVGVLPDLGWKIELEFGFNVFGERGSVDILGWHASTATLLIIEVKSRFTDLQAMLLSLARKIRLVPELTRDQLGWDADHVARVVVATGTTANRSIVQRHAAIFDTALPARSVAVRTWLRAPIGSIAGFWLVSPEALRARTR